MGLGNFIRPLWQEKFFLLFRFDGGRYLPIIRVDHNFFNLVPFPVFLSRCLGSKLDLVRQSLLTNPSCVLGAAMKEARWGYITLIFLQRGSAYHYPETSCKRKGSNIFDMGIWICTWHGDQNRELSTGVILRKIVYSETIDIACLVSPSTHPKTWERSTLHIFSHNLFTKHASLIHINSISKLYRFTHRPKQINKLTPSPSGGQNFSKPWCSEGRSFWRGV